MKRPVEVLTKSEVNQLIAKCSRRAPTGVRNRALITILYRSGLRLGEALALRPKDIETEETSTIRILHAKGDKSRVVSMDEQAFAVLDHWIDARKKLGIGNGSPIFCTLAGKSINSTQIRAWFRQLGRKCGIEKRVHAHGLRHTFAFELANEGIPIHVIQHALGHANVAITSLYISHLSPTVVIDTLKSREWAAA